MDENKTKGPRIRVFSIGGPSFFNIGGPTVFDSMPIEIEQVLSGFFFGRSLVQSSLCGVKDFVDIFEKGGRKKKLDQLIKETKDKMIPGIEADLLINLEDHQHHTEKCEVKSIIKKFVSIIGLSSFSEDFQKAWKSLGPITYVFGPDTTIIVGGLVATPIDRLLSALNKIRPFESILGKDLAGEISTEILTYIETPPLLAPGSELVLLLKKLLELSADCKDKDCESCTFLRNLILRTGFKNLPRYIGDLYDKAFARNAL